MASSSSNPHRHVSHQNLSQNQASDNNNILNTEPSQSGPKSGKIYQK